MRKIKVIFTSLILSFAMILAGCVHETPSVVFGFKTVDTAAEYNESISAFEIGRVFYTCITVKVNTNKKAARNYKVVITIPKTKDVEMEKMGGLQPDSRDWDPAKQTTVLNFTIHGAKEAISEKFMFYGTPVGEGAAAITVNIYDKDGIEINAGYSRTIFFKYELQE